MSSSGALRRAFRRKKHYQGRGQFLGVFNKSGREYLARITREAKIELAKEG